jgi:hypothetical protein
MLGKKPKVDGGESPPKPLHQRIEQFRAELADFIDDRVRRLKKSYPGLPEVTIRQTLVGNSNCECLNALKVLRDIEEEIEIAARQS